MGKCTSKKKYLPTGVDKDINSMATVSIITPIYKGRQYIPTLTQMIKACAIKASEIAKVELVIVNDYPEDNITEVDTGNLFEAQVLSADRNRGIQGARVRGLHAATGDYVTFWDQDDVFPENWIESQIRAIGDGNVVVCDQYRNGITYYGHSGRKTLEKVATREHLLNCDNGFIPGQVLIKKDIIPDLWKRRILSNNCADDYYLWLLLIAQGERFIVNKDTYFDHIIHGKNESLAIDDAYISINEMLGILKDEKVFSEKDFYALEAAQERRLHSQLRELGVVKEKMGILKSLLRLQEENISLADDRVTSASGKVFIYGADIGAHVWRKLSAEGVEIRAIIDRDANWLNIPMKAVTVDELSMDDPFIIMTLINQADKVTLDIYDNYPNAHVIHIRDLLNNMGA